MTRSQAQMGFLQVFGEHLAITSGLPCHLHQSAIEVTHDPPVRWEDGLRRCVDLEPLS
jgi:hypothetical protein